MSGCWSRCLVKLFIVAAALYGINLWIRVKDYHFDRLEIHNIAKPFVGRTGIDAAADIGNALRKRYGDLIPNYPVEWIFFKAGGAPGAAAVYYSSLTEYILVYGTEIAGSGYSGRHWANISDTILTGTLRKWSENNKVEVIGKGSLTDHAAFETAFVYNSESVWMLEYCRGFIPSMFPFLIADNIFSSADPLCLFHTFKVFGKYVLYDLGRLIGFQ